MSLNDKVKVIWKTNCEWRDRPHWPKRKDLKLNQDDGNGKELSALDRGDAVKMKFGSRWYDAEVCEKWEPKKSKKGKKAVHNPSLISLDKQQNPVSQMPTRKEVNEPVEDPYAVFLAEQQKREAMWSINRAAKKRKTADVETPQTQKSSTTSAESLTTNSPTKTENSVATQTAKTLAINVATQTSPRTLQQSDELSRLKKELQERDKTCDFLAKKVKDLEKNRDNEKHQLANDKLFKAVENVEETIMLMRDKMTAALERIGERLDRLEAAPVSSDLTPFENFNDSTLPAVEMMEETLAEISTIDASALSTFSESLSTTCSPVILQFSDHHGSSSPAITHVSQYPVSDSPLYVTGVVTDELIRSCVTPRKVQRVREALEAESQRDRCAVRLLQQFFTKEELAMGNTEGNFNKSPLDRTRLHSLKVLVFTKFPVGPDEDEGKCWRAVKTKINAKCRANRFACSNRVSTKRIRPN